MGLHLWLPPCFGPCQAENPGPFKSSDLQRTFTAAPGGAPQLQQRPRQCSPTQQSPLDPKSAQQSCWGLAPSYPRWIGKDGERGKGCHCCWLHMAQLAQAGSGFGCLLGIPCQSFLFRSSVCISTGTQLPAWFPAQLPQTLMGTHSLQLIVCCFPALLCSQTNYKTSML